MTPIAWIALCGVAITVFTLVGTSIWAVGTIRSTTEMLRSEIRSLGNDIRELRGTIKIIEERQWQQAQQIARLEVNHGAAE